MPTETDRAWAAGLFEGEGSITFGMRSRGVGLSSGRSCALNLGMTDRDVVSKFHNIVGVGSVYVYKRNDNDSKRKIQYRWSVKNKLGVEEVLCRLLPHLGERRATRAAELFDFCEQIKSSEDFHTCCRKGHSYDSSSSFYAKRCRICRLEWRRKQYAKQRQIKGIKTWDQHIQSVRAQVDTAAIAELLTL